jgi:hypothetical protein
MGEDEVSLRNCIYKQTVLTIGLSQHHTSPNTGNEWYQQARGASFWDEGRQCCKWWSAKAWVLSSFVTLGVGGMEEYVALGSSHNQHYKVSVIVTAGGDEPPSRIELWTWEEKKNDDITDRAAVSLRFFLVPSLLQQAETPDLFRQGLDGGRSGWIDRDRKGSIAPITEWIGQWSWEGF